MAKIRRGEVRKVLEELLGSLNLEWAWPGVITYRNSSRAIVSSNSLKALTDQVTSLQKRIEAVANLLDIELVYEPEGRWVAKKIKKGGKNG